MQVNKHTTLRAATPGDLEAIVELRAVVMRQDLMRLGRFDAERVRRRMRDAYAPQHTSVILHEDAFAGSVALRPVRTAGGSNTSTSGPTCRDAASARPSCAACWPGPTRPARPCG